MNATAPFVYVATDIEPGQTLRAWRHERRVGRQSSRRRLARALTRLMQQACRRCGRPNDGPYCPEHAPPPRPARQRCSDHAWRKVRAAVLERDRGVCQLRLCCDGAPATVVDHIVEAALGGSDDPSNLRSCCDPCHHERHHGQGGGDRKSVV